MQGSQGRVTYFGRTNTRHPRWKFGIMPHDRLSHVYIIGKTGAGKTTLLETMVSQDIGIGEGCALIDPHGDLVERVIARTPKERKQDLIYLNIPDANQPYGYNPLMRVSTDRRALVAAGLLDVFKKMWSDAWGVRMEHLLRNAILTLLDQPSATLPDILRLFSDKAFRRDALARVSHEPVRKFWTEEFEKYSYRYRSDAVAPLQNKVGAFLADPRLHRFLTRDDGLIRLRSAMDDGKILLVNLAKGQIGEDSASLLGGLLLTSLSLAAFSRADMPEEERRSFFVYADEFQNFTTLSIANMASELRKFGVGLTLAHQYLDQLDPDIKHAVIGNAGTLISFRLGAKDAGFIAKEFSPYFSATDLVGLQNYEMYVKLMIDGAPSHPFSATSLRPDDLEEHARLEF